MYTKVFNFQFQEPQLSKEGFTSPRRWLQQEQQEGLSVSTHTEPLPGFHLNFTSRQATATRSFVPDIKQGTKKFDVALCLYNQVQVQTHSFQAQTSRQLSQDRKAKPRPPPAKENPGNLSPQINTLIFCKIGSHHPHRPALFLNRIFWEDDEVQVWLCHEGTNPSQATLSPQTPNGGKEVQLSILVTYWNAGDLCGKQQKTLKKN